MSEEEQQDGRRLPRWLDWVLTIVIGLGVALILRLFVFEPFVVPSGSMLDTIQIGDLLVGEKVTYRTSSPKAGDIVTFVTPAPEQDGSHPILIKRVIATAGQTVDLQDGKVLVDGVTLDEDAYTQGKPSMPIPSHGANLSQDISYPYTVPEGCIWVMGDNRTNSSDSRYFGAVPISSVTSRALFIYWPIQDISTL